MKRTTRSRLIGWFALVAALAPDVRADVSANGGTESNLALGASSRGIGIGGAFAAAVDDASALYWNPGRLAALERGTLVVSHALIGVGDAAQTFVGVAYPTLGLGTFALGFERLGTDGIQAYDADSNARGTIEFSETALYAGYAHAIPLERWGALQLGGTLETVTQSLTPWSSTGTGLDLGCALSPRSPDWPQLAVVLRDAIAPRLRLDQADDVVPSTLHVGASWRLPLGGGRSLMLHGGADRLNTIGWSPRVGVEAGPHARLRLRAGYSRQGVVFGVGVGWQSASLDYAYLDRESAATHPVSLSTDFGPSLGARLERRAAARDAELRSQLESRLAERAAAAQIAFDRGDFATALDEWKIVAGFDPSDEKAQRGIAAAGAKLAELQARESANREQAAARTAQFELALKYYGASDYPMARAVWSQLQAQEPGNEEIQRYLVKTEAALAAQLDALADEAKRDEHAGDWVNALALWSRIRATAGTSAAAEAGIARCRSALDRKSTARAAAVDAAPKATPPSSVYADAVAAYANGDLTRAVALLRDVTKQDPANEAAARLLAKAERQLRPLTSEERAHVRELYLRGMSFFTANEFEKAIAEWTKILELEPGQNNVYENIREARARLRALQP